MMRLESPARPTILVVEDEEPVQQLVADLLDGEGYHVLVADDCLQALALIHTTSPDLVLTDLMMPVMNGVELCRRLRADERTLQVPIVVMTAAGRGQREAAGADAYVAKPFDLDVLLELVESYVGAVR